MTKKKAAKRKSKAASKRRTSLPPITQQAVERLEKLASDLDAASKEAGAVAALVRDGVTEELANHLIANKTDRP